MCFHSHHQALLPARSSCTVYFGFSCWIFCYCGVSSIWELFLRIITIFQFSRFFNSSIFCWFLKFSDLFLLVCCWQLVVWVWVLRGVYVCYLVSFLHWVFVFVRIRWLLLLLLLQVCCGLFGDLVLLNANNQQLCCSLFCSFFVYCSCFIL